MKNGGVPNGNGVDVAYNVNVTFTTNPSACNMLNLNLPSAGATLIKAISVSACQNQVVLVSAATKKKVKVDGVVVKKGTKCSFSNTPDTTGNYPALEIFLGQGGCTIQLM